MKARGRNQLLGTAATGQVVGPPIIVGHSPEGIWSDGSNVWVSNHDDNTVSMINATSKAVISTIPVGTGPDGIMSDGTHVWIANLNSNSITELSAASGSPVATISDGSFNQPVAVSSDGTDVWVANEGGNSVSKLDIATATVTDSIALGTSPDGIYSDGQFVWVAGMGFSPGAVFELDATSGNILNTIPVGGNFLIGGITSDGNNIWVTNDLDNTVSEIDPGNAPGRPMGVNAAPGTSSATVSWTAPISMGGSPITGYTVQYSFDGGATWTTATMCTGTATSCTVTGLTPGTSYLFQVAATNVVGTSEYSSSSPSITLAALASTGSNLGALLLTSGALVVGGATALATRRRRLQSH